jgi:hypothetical protein
MVMTSDQIAAQAGAFQQQVMLQNQYAGMLSQNAGAAPAGEQLMGHVANRGMGIGSAVLGGGLALAGMDPMSMAMKAGMAGFSGGGMMGAAGAAAGAFLPAYALWQAGSYAGGQVMQGMGQQQAINATMRQNYQFAGQTGRGFNMGEMGTIGQMLRAQTEVRGPGGEFAQMDELTRLAGNMGRMGLAQNVRSAKEFSDKFREMMTTVKEIATTFSTSLEQAQQVMVGMRQSGIFNNQAQVSQQIRAASVAGGLATSEVTGMMTVGSQLSRMIGGRGNAGAMGGMKTIANIGVAQQMGLLSEEQVYNLTGLEGAEGRRALATNMMQQSASFLQSGRGRAFLASIAGKGGTLNEASVQAYMYGGMSTGETMQSAHQNIAKMGGAAAFLRHQGRLRGEALGRFGGLADVMAMRGWVESRGLSLSPTDDRSMVFMQRVMGLSPEEAEFKLQQMRDLPQLLKRQDDAAADDDARKRLEQLRATKGLRGVKRDLEKFQHSVSSKLQEVGSDLYQEGSNFLERWVARFTGDYVQMMDRDIGQAVRASINQATDPYAQATLAKFGLAKNQFSSVRAQSLAEGPGLFKGSTNTTGYTDETLAAYKRAGYSDITQGNAAATIARARENTAAFARGTDMFVGIAQGPGVEDRLGDPAIEALKTAVGTGQISGSGPQRLDKWGSILKRSSNAELARLGEKWDGLSESQKNALIGTVSRQAGMGGTEAMMMSGPTEAGSPWQTGGFRTARDMAQAVGEYMYKSEGLETESTSPQAKRAAASLQGKGPKGMGLRGAEVNAAAVTVEAITGSRNREKEIIAFGNIMTSEQGRDVSMAIFSKNKFVRQQLRDRLRQESAALEVKAKEGGLMDEKGEVTDETIGAQLRFNQAADRASSYVDLMESTGGAPTEEDKKRFEEANGPGSFAKAKAQAAGFAEVGEQARRRASDAVWAGQAQYAAKWRGQLGASGQGLFGGEGGKMDAKTTASLRAAWGRTGGKLAEGMQSPGEAYAEMMNKEAKLREQIQPTAGLDEQQRSIVEAQNQKLQTEADQMRSSRQKMRASWTDAQAGAIMTTLGTRGGTEEDVGAFQQENAMMKRMRQTGVGRGGIAGRLGLAKAMNVQLTSDEKTNLQNMSDADAAAYIAQRGGITDAAALKTATEDFSGILSGKVKGREAAQKLVGAEQQAFGERAEREKEAKTKERDESNAALATAIAKAINDPANKPKENKNSLQEGGNVNVKGSVKIEE